ncbi:MAG TPA: hypothetical protein VMC85_21525 [Desulfomonilaceae bacterium]|nr:hypothetical protein [Desulfomonilaceae bacterium]
MFGKIINIIVAIVLLLATLNGCASLLDGKFVTKDGKESPFKPMTDPYAPPKDPTARF